MPKIPSSSITFAFSKRQDRWTTRYSFTPTCYANCGDIMLSSKDGLGIWKHDANTTRNTFYGDVAPSKLTIVSNEDPSAVKMFKAISLESNRNEWSAKFYTNEEQDNRHKQESNSINGFQDKEGFRYLEVPRDVLNSTENIYPCPNLFILSSILGFLSTSSQISFQVNSATTPNFTLNFSVALGSESLEVSVPSGKLVCIRDGELVGFPSFAPAPGLNLSDIYVSNFIDNTVQLNTQSWNTGSLAVSGFVGLLDSFLSYPLFIVSEASVNGDQMRGPYLRVDLTSATSKPLELHAVNVDYEFSKLDKRLTQNS